MVGQIIWQLLVLQPTCMKELQNHPHMHSSAGIEPLEVCNMQASIIPCRHAHPHNHAHRHGTRTHMHMHAHLRECKINNEVHAHRCKCTNAILHECRCRQTDRKGWGHTYRPRSMQCFFANQLSSMPVRAPGLSSQPHSGSTGRSPVLSPPPSL